MPLYQIKDFDPNYRQHFDDRDILKFDVYSGSEKVGSVDDLLVDDAGQFRYFVINTGAWIVGKKVLLPIGQSRIDDISRRVYVDGLTRDQVKHLPEYKGEAVDYDYEERVRGVYRPAIASRGATSVPATYDRHSYRYDHDPALYNLNDRDHGSLRRSEARLMSERPISGKHRRSVGVFPTRQAAEQALHELRDSGFPMGRVSVVTRDADKHDEIAGADVRDRVGNKADEGATIGAVSGGALGGLTGLLVGLGTLAIPGVGPIMLAGATATALATTLAGGAIGAVSGGLLGALLGLGIPEERARAYQDRIAQGGYLVIVDGTDADIARAETILHHRGIEDYGVYDAPSTPNANVPGATAPASTVHSSAVHDTTTVHDRTQSVPTTHTATTIDTTPAIGRTAMGRRSAVGFFTNLSDAEQAIADLRGIGFLLHQITLVAHNLSRRDRLVGVDLRDRFEAARMGISPEQARGYHDRLGRGEHMVIVQGTEEELNRAAPILTRRGVQEWRMYDSGMVDEQPDHDRMHRTDRSIATTPVTSTSGSPVGLQHKRAIGLFSHRRDAETALTELRNAGFPLDRVSLIAKHAGENDRIAGVETHSETGNKADEGAKAGAVAGGALGGLGGLLVGLGTLALPGIGPVLLGGATATAIATTLAGGAIGAVAGGLTGALVGLGIPEDRAKVYNDRVTKGDYLVMIDGSETETRQAEAILRRHHIHEWGIYDATDVDATRHPRTTGERHTAPDVDPIHRDREARIDHAQPQVTIIDNRDETHR